MTAVKEKSILGIFVMWVGALVWHLYRIATFRPAYKYLADTPVVQTTFMGLYYVAGLTRWVFANPAVADGDFVKSMGIQLFGLTVHAAVLTLFTRPTKQNASLFATVLGASALVDFCVVVAFQMGFTDSMTSMEATIAENLLYVVCWLTFHREPEEVRASGYRKQGA